MSTITAPLGKAPVVYPESDGLPMADNTKQFRWITTIEGGLEAMFRDEPNIFVAGNLLWYPVEGNNLIRCAPDVFVVFGRPKGDRGSYLQWLEDNIPPQVVFEIYSPGNRPSGLLKKFQFFERYGVEEYYLYDPSEGDLAGWIRDKESLQEIPEMCGWVSPRLGVRFDLHEGELCLYGPDGAKFASYVELAEQRAQAQQQATQAQQQAEQAQQRAERLAAQLKALGVDPEV